MSTEAEISIDIGQVPRAEEFTSQAKDATAFVLGGGGSLGAVQVGMLQALLRAGIRPDLVVGTSIGSLNGAYLAGHPDLDGVRHLGELWASVRRSQIFRVNVRRIVGGVMGNRDHIFDALGLRSLLYRADLGFERIEDAPIPLHVVATDLLDGKPVVLSSGDLIESLVASAAIPGIFPPVRLGGRTLVDGGVLANVPMLQAIELSATRLFVLPALNDEVATISGNAIDMMQRSMMIATSAVTRQDLLKVAGSADVHVLPVPVNAQVSMFDFGDSRTLIEDAYAAAAAWLDASELEVAADERIGAVGR